jgi:hypothetical protein
MKRLAFLLLFLPVVAFAAETSSINRGNAPAHTSLVRHFTNADTAATGSAYNLNALYSNHVWQIIIEGDIPSPLNVKIDGSIDGGANWFVMDSYSTLTPENRMAWIVNHPTDMARVRLVTFTNGSTITINSKHGGN